MNSACRVYAIVDRNTPLPAAGAGDAFADLAVVSCRGLGAVTGPSRDEGATVTVNAVLHHEAVVEAVRRQGPALPVRFGTVFPDATSVTAALAQRYAPLAADLARLGDKVELSLTALWAASSSGADAPDAHPDAPPSAEHGAGARYLLARAEQLRCEDTLKERARAAAREVDAVLGTLALERRVSILPTPRVAIRTAYLLEPADVGAFRTALESVSGSRGELRLLLTGPWPPYSFVRRSDGDEPGAPDGRLTALVRLLTDERRERGG